MSWHARITPVVALGTLSLALAACGSDDSDAADATTDDTAAGSAAAVHLTDSGCSPATLTVTRAAGSGSVSFEVRNDTDDRGEFEIISPAPEILAEEFVDAGQSATYDVVLAAGSYEIICGLPSNARAALTVNGAAGETAAPASTVVDATALQQAAAAYQDFVAEQVHELQTQVQAFTDAVRAGNLDAAKSLYAPVRVPWEMIEPVAELFPDSDAVIDSRSDDFPQGEADPDFTGFHAIEYGLFAQGTINGAEVDLPALADRLDADIATLIGNVTGLTIAPQVMTNGAAALIEEAAQTKITGEEDRYSKTDLYTFDANVRGALEVFTLVEPLLRTVNADLADQITENFAAVNAALDPYRTTDGFAPYDEVSTADQNTFKTTMASLSESLAQVTGSLGLVVTG